MRAYTEVMATPNASFSDTDRLTDQVAYFELGHAPSGALTWRNSTPDQRLEATEWLRTINYGDAYDADAPLFPAAVRIIDRRGR